MEAGVLSIKFGQECCVGAIIHTKRTTSGTAGAVLRYVRPGEVIRYSKKIWSPDMLRDFQSSAGIILEITNPETAVGLPEKISVEIGDQTISLNFEEKFTPLSSGQKYYNFLGIDFIKGLLSSVGRLIRR